MVLTFLIASVLFGIIGILVRTMSSVTAALDLKVLAGIFVAVLVAVAFSLFRRAQGRFRDIGRDHSERFIAHDAFSRRIGHHTLGWLIARGANVVICVMFVLMVLIAAGMFRAEVELVHVLTLFAGDI